MKVGTRYKTINDDILTITRIGGYSCDFKLDDGRTYKDIERTLVINKIRVGRLIEIKTKQIFKMSRLRFG